MDASTVDTGDTTTNSEVAQAPRIPALDIQFNVVNDADAVLISKPTNLNVQSPPSEPATAVPPSELRIEEARDQMLFSVSIEQKASPISHNIADEDIYIHREKNIEKDTPAVPEKVTNPKPKSTKSKSTDSSKSSKSKSSKSKSPTSTKSNKKKRKLAELEPPPKRKKQKPNPVTLRRSKRHMNKNNPSASPKPSVSESVAQRPKKVVEPRVSSVKSKKKKFRGPGNCIKCGKFQKFTATKNTQTNQQKTVEPAAVAQTTLSISRFLNTAQYQHPAPPPAPKRSSVSVGLQTNGLANVPEPISVSLPSHYPQPKKSAVQQRNSPKRNSPKRVEVRSSQPATMNLFDRIMQRRSQPKPFAIENSRHSTKDRVPSLRFPDPYPDSSQSPSPEPKRSAVHQRSSPKRVEMRRTQRRITELSSDSSQSQSPEPPKPKKSIVQHRSTPKPKRIAARHLRRNKANRRTTRHSEIKRSKKTKPKTNLRKSAVLSDIVEAYDDDIDAWIESEETTEDSSEMTIDSHAKPLAYDGFTSKRTSLRLWVKKRKFTDMPKSYNSSSESSSDSETESEDDTIQIKRRTMDGTEKYDRKDIVWMRYGRSREPAIIVDRIFDKENNVWTSEYQCMWLNWKDEDDENGRMGLLSITSELVTKIQGKISEAQLKKLSDDDVLSDDAVEAIRKCRLDVYQKYYARRSRSV